MPTTTMLMVRASCPLHLALMGTACTANRSKSLRKIGIRANRSIPRLAGMLDADRPRSMVAVVRVSTLFLFFGQMLRSHSLDCLDLRPYSLNGYREQVDGVGLVKMPFRSTKYCEWCQAHVVPAFQIRPVFEEPRAVPKACGHSGCVLENHEGCCCTRFRSF
jgi:hypothetical protein